MYYIIILLSISAFLISYIYRKTSQLIRSTENKALHIKENLQVTTAKQAENFQQLLSLYCTLEQEKQQQYFKQLTKKTIVSYKQQNIYFKGHKLTPVPSEKNRSRNT